MNIRRIGLWYFNYKADFDMNRGISLGLLGEGIILLFFGIRESDSIASEFSRLFTGSPTDRSIWMLAGGTALFIIGLAGLLRGSRAA